MPRRPTGLAQALVQALAQDVLRQVNTDEYHAAFALFIGSPFGAQIAAHQLVYALKDHFAAGALHVQHALVAQHARAVDVHNRTQKVFQLGRIEWAGGTVHKAFHIVIVVMVVRVVAVLAMLMVVVVVMAMRTVAVVMVAVAVVVVLQKIGIDFEFGVQIKAAQIEHLF